MKEGYEDGGGCGKMMIFAALLLALGMIGGGYMLAQGDYSPKVDLSHFNSTPNVYVSSAPPEHDLSVSATATRKVAPDLLQIDLRVETEALNAKDAQQQNAQVMTDLLTKLKNLGIPEEKIQTSSYSVDEVRESNYVCDKDDRNCHWDYELKGYKAVHRLTVDVEQLDKGGDVIDAAATAGVNQTFVDSVSFTLKETTRSEMAKTLLQEAAVAAKAKAQRIATGLEITLGKVVYASENSYATPYYYNNYKALPSAGASYEDVSTTISPGQVDMSASVSVSYELNN
ncbi:Uncharacterised protein [Candidatus Bilamarchaeum dharawalense]|uniref:Oxidative stress defense protein n=1 Tax=Candidatus Bilamarchaeum dharawalense TaxID=2885759 RepID=A0A5E4LQ12_9ARCH|nr:Uncharacterised protein [Candidatus Bilamarchaeum dharawalense]